LSQDKSINEACRWRRFGGRALRWGHGSQWSQYL